MKKISLLMLMFLSGCASRGRDPDNQSVDADAYYRLAFTARKSGNSQVAINFLEKIKNASKPEYQILLAECYLDTHNVSLVKKILQKLEAQELDTAHMKQVNYLRGKLLILEGKKDEAIEILKNISTPEAYNALGVMYNKKGEYQMAQQSYKKAMELDHSQIDAYHNFGVSAILEGDYEKAIVYLEKAVCMPDASISQRSTLGFAYVMAGKEKEARDIYRHDYTEDKVDSYIASIKKMKKQPQSL